MQRYFNHQPIKGHLFSLHTPKYDKNVVDKSRWNPNQDSLADFMRSEMSQASSGTPIYDTVNGKVTNIPSDIEIALRNNRLSRAEVSELARSAENDLNKAVDASKKAKAKESKEAIEKARQEYMDAKTGFDPAQVQVNSTDK